MPTSIQFNLKIMKQFFTLCLLCAIISISLVAHAADLEVDGIYYNITSKSNHLVETCSGPLVYIDNVVIPATFEYDGATYKVKGIGYDTFGGCSHLNSVTIPEGVTYISQYAFSSSTVQNITLPQSLKQISNSAFRSCERLTTMNIPDQVQTIGSSAFRGCSYLKSIHLPESLDTIPGWLFEGCNRLKEITGAQTLKYIGISAFKDCTSLTDFTLPEGIEKIESEAFKGSGIKFTSLPASLSYIGDYTFSRQSGITALPPNITHIGNYGFGETGLKEVDTQSLTEVGWNIFYNCKNLKKGVVGTLYEDMFNGCDSLETIIFKLDHNAVADGTFYRCELLKDIDFRKISSIDKWAFGHCYLIPSTLDLSNVEKIRTNAFLNCNSIKHVIFSNTLTSYERGAFDGCIGLTDVYVKSETPPACFSGSGSAVLNNLQKCTLHVPEGSLMLYKRTPVWMEFRKIVDDLNVALSGITETELDAPTQITVSDGRIIAPGIVEVFDTMGRCVAKGEADSLPLLSPGIYVVRAAGIVTKVRI